ETTENHSGNPIGASRLSLPPDRAVGDAVRSRRLLAPRTLRRCGSRLAPGRALREPVVLLCDFPEPADERTEGGVLVRRADRRRGLAPVATAPVASPRSKITSPTAVHAATTTPGQATAPGEIAEARTQLGWHVDRGPVPIGAIVELPAWQLLANIGETTGRRRDWRWAFSPEASALAREALIS